jgi:hypothetical protein
MGLSFQPMWWSLMIDHHTPTKHLDHCHHRYIICWNIVPLLKCRLSKWSILVFLAQYILIIVCWHNAWRWIGVEQGDDSINSSKEETHKTINPPSLTNCNCPAFHKASLPSPTPSMYTNSPSHPEHVTLKSLGHNPPPLPANHNCPVCSRQNYHWVCN